MKKLWYVVGLFCLGMVSPVYAGFLFFTPGFSGPIDCPRMTQVNMESSELCGSEITTVAYHDTAEPYFEGITLTMTSTHADGVIPVMQRNPLIVRDGVVLPDQEVPFKVEWKPCFNGAFGGTTPNFMNLEVNVGLSVSFPYGNEDACADAAGGVTGALKVTREALVTLPESGNYEDSITFTVSAE